MCVCVSLKWPAKIALINSIQRTSVMYKCSTYAQKHTKTYLCSLIIYKYIYNYLSQVEMNNDNNYQHFITLSATFYIYMSNYKQIKQYINIHT